MKKLILIITLFLIIINLVSADLTTDLAYYWDFDSSTCRENITNTVCGAVDNPTHTDTGFIGGAWLYDGNDAFDTNIDSGTLTSTSWCINLWFYNTDSASSAIIDASFSGGNSWTFFSNRDNFLINFFYHSGNQIFSTDPENYTEVYRMATASSDGTTMRIFVNGTFQASNSNVKPLSDDLDIFFAKYADSDSAFMTGSIDEVVIYQRNCSYADILELWNDGAGKNPLVSSNNAPVVTLITLVNNTHTDDDTPNFVFSYSDADGDNGFCELFINDTASGVNPSNFTPDIVNVQVGTYNDGNVASLNTIDGDVYNVSEVTGSPASTIEINLTIGNNTPLNVLAYLNYDGNLGHNIDFLSLQDDGTYVILDSFSDMGGYTYLNVSIGLNNVQDGVASFLFNHTSSGNVNHELVIDYFAVETVVNETASIIVNHTLSDGGYSVYVNCSDGTDNTQSDVFYFVVDTVNPVITWTVPLDDDSSVYTTSTSSFNTDINISDDNLFSYNLSLYNSSGSLIQSSEINNLNVTSYLITDNIDLSSLPFDTYTVNVTISDDHTASSWSAEKIDFRESDNRLKIDDYISVMPENFDITGYTITEYSDRIGYSFTPDNVAPSLLSYEVECDEGLVYRPNSLYKAHFVCGRYWIDFENDADAPVTVEILSSKQAIVYTSAHTFNSIGGLNIVSETRTFIYSDYLSLESPFPVNNSIIYTDYVDFSVIGNFSLNASCFLNINSTFNASTVVSPSSSDYNVSFTGINFSDGTYDFNINCVDAITDITTSTNNFLVIHANCSDIGTIDTCSIYDNTTQRHVYSPSGCDVDLNETVACNYCSQDLEETLGDCENDNQTVTYVDNNFISCCYITSIGSDCEIFTSPYNETTYQVCDALIQNFTCDIPSIVEFKDRMPFSCLMPDNNVYKCVVNVYESGRLVQTNPEQTIYATSLIGGKKLETREFFTTANGLLNAYYTDKNIETNHVFRVDIICSDGNTTIYSQNNVNPFYDGLGNVLNRGVWVGENATTLIIVLMLVLLVLAGIGYALKKVKGR